MIGLLLLAVGSVCIFAFWSLARRRLVAHRASLPIASIHESVAAEVEFGSFKDVVEAVANAYGVDPEKIRPHDAFDDFMATDTWRMDAGTDALNDWLVAQGFVEEPLAVKTVLDLAKRLEGIRYEHRGRGEACE